MLSAMALSVSFIALQLIEDLRKQLELLQLFKLEAEQRRGRSSSMGLQEYNSRTREMELEQEIRRLKQVLGRWRQHVGSDTRHQSIQNHNSSFDFHIVPQ